MNERSLEHFKWKDILSKTNLRSYESINFGEKPLSKTNFFYELIKMKGLIEQKKLNVLYMERLILKKMNWAIQMKGLCMEWLILKKKIEQNKWKVFWDFKKERTNLAKQIEGLWSFKKWKDILNKTNWTSYVWSD